MAKMYEGKIVSDRYNPNLKKNQKKIAKIHFDIGTKFWTIMRDSKYSLFEGVVTGVDGNIRKVFCENKRTNKKGEWQFEVSRLRILED